MISFVQLMVISVATAVATALTGTIIHLLVFDAAIIALLIAVQRNFPAWWDTHICATQPIDGEYPQR